MNFSNTFDFSTYSSIFHSTAILVSIGLGACLQAFFGSFLIRKFVGYPSPLLKNRDIILFFLLGGPISCLTNATVAVLTLAMNRMISANQMSLHWWTWWVGDSIGVLIFTPMILIRIRETKAAWKRRWKSIFIPQIIMVTLVISIFIQAQKWEVQQSEYRFTRQTEHLFQNINKNFQSYLVTLYSLKSFYENSNGLEKHKFTSLVQTFVGEHPSIQFLSWLPVVPDDQRALFEEQTQRNGSPNFHITELDEDGKRVIARQKKQYIPMYFIEPLKTNQENFGFDLSSLPAQETAIETAGDTGQAFATMGESLVPGRRELGLVIYVPLYRKTSAKMDEASRRKNVVGYIAGGYQIQNILLEVLDPESLQGLRIRILDTNAQVGHQLVYDFQNIEDLTNISNPRFQDKNRKTPTRTIPLNMAGRQFQLEFTSTNANNSYEPSWISLSILTTGLIFTSLFGIFLFIVTGSEARTRAQVVEQTVEIRRSEERFRELLESAPDGIIIFDEQGNLEIVNERTQKMFGYPREALLRLKISELIFENMDERQNYPGKQFFEGFLYHNAGNELQLYGKKNTAEKFPIEVHLNSITSSEEKWISASIRDVTKRKEVDELKNQFFEMISHELRTPLSPIHQFTTIIMDGLGGEVTEQQKEYLGIILKNTIQLQNIIADLVDVSRMSTGKISTHCEVVDASDMAEKIVRSFQKTAEDKSISLNFILSRLPAVWVDPVRFEQVLRNLIDNAIKYTHADGSITVSASDSTQYEGFVCFSVRDTGQGIAKEDIDLVFERLYQTGDRFKSSRKGLGLGLHICKDLVERQGGKIWLESEIGKGSTFYFTFPVFQFTSLLAPLFEKDQKPPESLGLITIEIESLKETNDERKTESLKELENYLSHSILPYDVIIPTKKKNEEKFFILVSSDEIGMNAVINRIQGQWVSKMKFGISDLGLSFRCQMLPIFPEMFVNKTKDEMLKTISDLLEGVIGGIV